MLGATRRVSEVRPNAGASAETASSYLADRPRLRELAAENPDAAALATRLCQLAVDGLPRMLLSTGVGAGEGAFAHTRRAFADAGRLTIRLEGRSERYSGIVALGARHLDEDLQRLVLGGPNAQEAADALVARLGNDTRLGDAAIATWATAATEAPRLQDALDMLDAAIARTPVPYVVEQAWVLSALIAARPLIDTDSRLAQARRQLMNSRSPGSGLFPHAVGAGLVPRWRAHVACFADQVYPIQALARLHMASGDDPDALAAAETSHGSDLPLAGGRRTVVVALRRPGPARWWRATRCTACTSTRWARWLCSTCSQLAAESRCRTIADGLRLDAGTTGITRGPHPRGPRPHLAQGRPARPAEACSCRDGHRHGGATWAASDPPGQGPHAERDRP